MPNKYPAPSIPEVRKSFESLGGSLIPKDKKLKLHEDGTLEVENLVERSSNNLSFSLDKKEQNFLFSKPLDENTSIEFLPEGTHKQYKTKIKKTFSLKNALAVYEGEVKRFIVEKLGRFKSLRKAHKKQVNSIRKTKSDYIFTEKKYGSTWAKPYIKSTVLGPYNYDVKLVTKRDVEFINDIITIRTGEFLLAITDNVYRFKPFRTKILWVSPHEMVNYRGSGNYLSTGEYLSSQEVSSQVTTYNRKYRKRNNGISNNVDCFALTSKSVKLHSNSVLKTEMEYTFSNENGQSPKYSDPIPSTFFYSFYEEYKDICESGNWNGIIPSGTPISIDVWSTNPRYIGFDGDIAVVPVDESLAESLNFSCDVECEAVSLDYQDSVRKAIDKAKGKFYRKLNNYLISKGLKKKCSRVKRFELLLERVAQNVFDGLTILRNDQVIKAQGTEKLSPLDSPMYYDGTSKMYGGSEDHSNFNKQNVPNSRMQGVGVDTVHVHNNGNGHQGY